MGVVNRILHFWMSVFGSRTIMAYCLLWYEEVLDGKVKGVRGLTDRVLLVFSYLAVVMARNEQEREVLEKYHSDYLWGHLGGYGPKHLMVIVGSGGLYATLSSEHDEWVRRQTRLGWKTLQPYHGRGEEVEQFHRKYGSSAIEATPEKLSLRFGCKGTLRQECANVRSGRDFLPHVVCATLEELYTATADMLLRHESVRVVFNGCSASGDGVTRFSRETFSRCAFNVAAEIGCEHLAEGEDHVFMVEQWASDGDPIPLSFTGRVRRGRGKITGATYQLEKPTKQGGRAHQGNTTCNDDAYLIPTQWLDQHEWSRARARRKVREIRRVLNRHYVRKMARMGWRGAFGFDVILLSDGSWFLVEVNDRNCGSRPATDHLLFEVRRLFGGWWIGQILSHFFNRRRFILVRNIEDLPPMPIEEHVYALEHPWEIDPLGDLSRPRRNLPWVLLGLPRSSREPQPKTIMVISASTERELNRAQKEALWRLHRNATACANQQSIVAR